MELALHFGVADNFIQCWNDLLQLISFSFQEDSTLYLYLYTYETGAASGS